MGDENETQQINILEVTDDAGIPRRFVARIARLYEKLSELDGIPEYSGEWIYLMSMVFHQGYQEGYQDNQGEFEEQVERGEWSHAKGLN